jgi:hypothetical protein
MADHVTKWASYSGWSGVSIRGLNTYNKIPPATEWEVVMAAIAKPEGGAFDTVVSYDGTALTWGIAQWTFTSGRLQKLLAKIVSYYGLSSGFATQIAAALKPFGLNLDVLHGRLLDAKTDKEVLDKAQLRNILTPPSGCVPKTGPNWEKAKALALFFADLGMDPGAARIQWEFLKEELSREALLGRPKLGGKSIADFLYLAPNDGADTPSVCNQLIAARALFWSMWQNSPRSAEDHMLRVWPHPVSVDPKELRRFSSIFARSTFGNWGNAKAKQNGRESRYHKTATEINRVTGIPQILDPEII